MRPQIVLGPPGTGKTTTLLKRVDKALQDGTPAHRIAYVSFTKRAAEEAVTRACQKFDKERKEFKWFRTLHSMCFQSLGYKSEDVLQGLKLTRDFARYARTVIQSKWSEDGTLVGFLPGDRALYIENLARITEKDLRRTYDDLTDDPGVRWDELARIAACLKKFKEENGYVDFTDFLSEFVKTGGELSIDELFVDEAQDLSPLQWRVVRQIARPCKRVTIAGDDDQAIYEWAGADVPGFISLEGDAEVLGQSWRVPRAVQKVAEGLISKVKHRRPKTWAPRDEDGIAERVQTFDQLALDGQDILILARNNYTLSEMENGLRDRGVLYTVGARASLAPSSRDAILYWTRLKRGAALEPADVRKVYAKMTTRKQVAYGFKTLKNAPEDELLTINDLKENYGLLTEGDWYEALGELTSGEVAYVKNCLQKGEILTRPPRVRLQTIHGAKGGEADHVVLLLEVARRSYENQIKKPDEELRVWYVAVTRARRRLTLVEAPTDMRCLWL